MNLQQTKQNGFWAERQYYLISENIRTVILFPCQLDHHVLCSSSNQLIHKISPTIDLRKCVLSSVRDPVHVQWVGGSSRQDAGPGLHHRQAAQARGVQGGAAVRWRPRRRSPAGRRVSDPPRARRPDWPRLHPPRHQLPALWSSQEKREWGARSTYTLFYPSS